MSPEPLPPGVGAVLHQHCADGHPHPPPPGVGCCRIRGGEVVYADPTIWISRVLLDIWHKFGAPPIVEFECRGHPQHVGDIVRLNGTNQRVVYVVVGPVQTGLPEDLDAYLLRWPD